MGTGYGHMSRIAVRGDFMLYVMSGVFMFMTHIKAIGGRKAVEKESDGTAKEKNPIMVVIEI